jgi:hypothetical protein
MDRFSFELLFVAALFLAALYAVCRSSGRA